MRRLPVVVIGLLFLCLLPVHAQTVSQTLQWDQALNGAQTFADIQAFTYTLKIDAGAVTPITPTCVAGTPPKCSTPIAFDRSVAHTFVIGVANAFGSVSGTLVYNPGASPSGPVNIVIVTKITVP